MAEDGSTGAGIKSLDSALAVLMRLAGRNEAVTLSDLARDCDMPPSKVHRYLASFMAAGLVKQEGRSGRYDLGPGALQLGLAALARHDFVNFAADGLPDLAARMGMTVLLSVWGNEGATVVRWEKGITPTVTSMGLGTTLPLLNSATGRAFLAWAPEGAISAAREAELRRASRNLGLLHDVPATKSGLAALVARIRARGVATIEGKYIPGLVAASAPVLDWQDEAQAVITVVGTDLSQIAEGSANERHLIRYCAEKSVRQPG